MEKCSWVSPSSFFASFFAGLAVRLPTLHDVLLILGGEPFGKRSANGRFLLEVVSGAVTVEEEGSNEDSLAARRGLEFCEP